jgi:hypothetical protein
MCQMCGGVNLSKLPVRLAYEAVLFVVDRQVVRLMSSVNLFSVTCLIVKRNLVHVENSY